ncbi:DUF5305 family protein [Chloroflexota bacterium]
MNLRRTWLMAVTGVLVLASIIGVISAFNAPLTLEKKVTRLTYGLTASFDHKTFGRPVIPPEPDLITYPKITDSIAVSYSYEFLTEQPLTGVTEMLEVTITLGSPQTWQKEIVLLPSTKKTGRFTVTFPFDSESLIQTAIDISDNLSSGQPSTLAVLTAKVRTSAATASGTFTSEFIQTCDVNLGTNVIRWRQPFALERKGYWEGIIYEEKGEFAVTALMKSNLLGLEMAQSRSTGQAPLLLSPPLSQYPKDTTQLIEIIFSGELKSDPGVGQVNNDVTIEAVLTGPGGRKYSFDLLNTSVTEGKFSIASSPIDIAVLYSIIDTGQEMSLVPPSGYDLLIQGNIHTVAQSGFGAIEDSISPALTARLGQKGVAWPEQDEMTKSGEFTDVEVVTNRDRTPAIIGSCGAFVMMTIGLLFSVWRYMETRKILLPVPPLIAEAAQAKKRHKDLIVDIEDLEALQAGTIVNFSSLDELIKIGDVLLKPVLHKVDPTAHIYCVVDTSVRYQYVSISKE